MQNNITNPMNYLRKALDSACATVAMAETNRNSTLNKQAFSIASYLDQGLIPEEEFSQELLAAALSTGLPEKEAKRVIRNAFKKGRQNPNNITAMAVVNTHYQEHDVYIGRTCHGYQGSPLGNPFKGGDGRLNAVELYREWLWKRVKSETPAVMEQLALILDFHRTHGFVRLGCWCAPKLCHGNIVVRALCNPQVRERIAEFNAKQSAPF